MPCLPPWDPPNPGIEPRSPAWQADSLPAEPLLGIFCYELKIFLYTLGINSLSDIWLAGIFSHSTSFLFVFFDGFLCRAEASKSDIASLGYFALVARMLDCSSCVQLCVTPWTVALQTPLSIGFSRQEYWSGLPCPPPEDLPDPGIEPRSADAGSFVTI